MQLNQLTKMKTKVALVAMTVMAGTALIGASAAHGATAVDTTGSCDSVAGNLVVNCGFETGNASGYTESPSDQYTGTDLDASYGGGPHSGSHLYTFGSRGQDSTLAQTIAVTPNTSYQLSYYLEALDDGQPSYPGDFSATVSGTNSGDQTSGQLQDGTPFAYRQFTTNFVSDGSGSVAITFTGYNTDSDFFLDDVALVATTTSTPPLQRAVVTSISPKTGPAVGGTTVVITGSHFTGATQVIFAQTQASFTVDSDTQITATSPAHAAGKVPVRVHTVNLSVKNAGDVYKYTGSNVAS